MGRGRGRGRGRGDRGRGHAHSDDDGFDVAPAHGGFKGASGLPKNDKNDDTSSARPTGVQLAVHSKTPKFLQPYAHLLEKGNRKARPPRIASEDEGDGQDDQGVADAMMRALDEQPELKVDLQSAEVKRMQAEAAKERGNDAFKAKDFPAAVQHYDNAILADNTNAAYYSNRSAAHAALEQWEEARSDGARAANLRPAWAKAWTRLGAALMGLQDFDEAKDAFTKAMELEPDDKTITNAWLKADHEARQASQSGRLAFNKRKLKAATTSAPGRAAAGDPGRATAASAGAAEPGRRGRGAQRGGRGRGRGRHRAQAWHGSDGDDDGGGAAPAEPAAKKAKAKRAMLSFGDESDGGGSGESGEAA
eukprot:jgi/Ulvmu1/1741/UM117_0018.1